MEVKLIASTCLNGLEWRSETLGHVLGPYRLHNDNQTATDADELAELAGRECYQSWDRPNEKTASSLGYLANIIAQQHFSVLEHASASFRVAGVSRTLTHELVRHRHLSFSQVSQRYVDESQGDVVAHPALRPDHSVQLKAWSDEARTRYTVLVDELMKLGYDRKTARGAARGVLLNATPTSLIVTGNHRAWREFLHKRLSPAADAEIRELATLLLAELKRIAPNTYQDIEVKS